MYIEVKHGNFPIIFLSLVSPSVPLFSMSVMLNTFPSFFQMGKRRQKMEEVLHWLKSGKLRFTPLQ